MLNVTEVKFNGAKGDSAALYQYDYGQILTFPDLDLPEAYEVHFARQSDAQTITMIGTADGVAVPDEMLLPAGHIKVDIYLHEGETDGETEYKAIIPVIARPEPSHEEPTPVQQSEITQLVAALNTAVNEAEGYAQDAQEAAESIPEHVLVYDEQTLTDAEKAQARANIGAIGSADIPTEIFWVTYQSTTAQQISSAISSGKYPVLKYGNGFDSPRIIAPLTNQFDSYTFECVQGSEFIQFVLSSGTWSMTRIRDHNIKYDAQSLTTSQKSQARSNIGAISSADVPAKTSELTNDSGYVTQWTAPVRSVNDQTGAVQLHSVLYDSQTLTDLQKSQARQNIDVPSMDDFDTVADNAYEALGKADWAVSYNPVQTLTDQEKADARSNIDAVSADDVNALLLASLITDTASGDPCAIPDGASAPVVDCTVQIVPKQEGSGTPSPSNIRPISGWTEMTMRRTGLNLWDEEWELGSFNQSTGEPYADTTHIRSKNYIPVVGGKTYYVANARITWYEYGDNYSFLRVGNSGAYVGANATFVPSSDAKYIKFNTATAYGTTYKNDICISVSGSKNGTYEPYTGTQTYTQSWTPTVYGGTLDLTTGVLTVTYGMVDLGSLTWSQLSNSSLFYAPNANQTNLEGDSNLVCSHYETYPTARPRASDANDKLTDKQICRSYSTSQPFVYVKDSTYTDAQTFATAMSGVMLCYELAEPTTIQLTPTEVQTILGSNTFSADTGSVTVEYKADTELWVEGHVPSKTSQLTNDSGFITASNAPVRSVTGKTGVVTIANATTSAAGLMSATDKSRLDDLYADYSSALTALGV